MSMTENRQRVGKSGARLLWAATVACLVVLVAVVLMVVPRADTVYDEGGYLYEGWLVVSQGWRPFADFHTKTLPGLFYIYGVGQSLLGPSVLVGRLQATAFAMATLLLSALLAIRLSGNRWSGVLVLGLFGLNLQAAVTYYRALAIPPTAFFLIAAVYLVLLDRGRPWRLYVGCLAAAGVTLCRHDMLPVTLLVWLYVWLSGRGRPGSHAAAAPLVAAGLLAVLCVHFYSLSPENFARVMSVGLVSGGGMFAPYGRAVGASMDMIAWHLMMFLRWYLAPLLLLAAASGYVLSRRLDGGETLSAMLARHQGIGLLLGCAAVNYGLHAGVSIVLRKNIFYMLDMYIFFLVVAAAAAAFGRLALRVETASVRWILGAVGVALVLAAPVVNGIPPQFSGQETPHLRQIDFGAQAIGRLIPPDEWIFSLDDPHQFLQAGRKLYPQLTHQLFLYAAEGDPQVIRRRHYYDRAMIDYWLSGHARYAVMGDGLFDWMVEGGRHEGGAQLRDSIVQRLEGNYTLVETVEGSYMGPTRIYERKQ